MPRKEVMGWGNHTLATELPPSPMGAGPPQISPISQQGPGGQLLSEESVLVTTEVRESRAGRNLYLEEDTELAGWFPGLIRYPQSSMAPGQMDSPISTLLNLAQSPQREGTALTHPSSMSPALLRPLPPCHCQL